MHETFAIAALWLALALVATFLGSRLKVSNALMEICVGIAAGAVAAHYFAPDAMGAKLPWVTFIASTGAVVLTFLAGAELDPGTMRARWREVVFVGLVSFAGPFLGCAAIARFVLGWSPEASWLAGIALSTTSMAVVYAVMLETGLNKTAFGKGILGACFVTDLGTVIALGLMFAPFTWRTAVFVAASVVAFVALPVITPRLINHYANRTAAFRTKWVLFILFGLGALALWAGSEAVLPAYIAGMLLSGESQLDLGEAGRQNRLWRRNDHLTTCHRVITGLGDVGRARRRLSRARCRQTRIRWPWGAWRFLRHCSVAGWDGRVRPT